MERQAYFREIPRVDALLSEPEMVALSRQYGRGFVLDVTRRELDRLRETVQTGEEEEIREALDHFRERLLERIRLEGRMPLQRVYNGTGILLHTNLGRAPLGEPQIRAALAAMEGYSDLEYDLEEGKRGKRSSHFAETVKRVTGAEAAVAVNNNAAAVMLTLTALAQGKEVIVSRGELIEIGGHFRIPEVMEQSGAVLRETGTTNCTRLLDYERMITPETGVLMKVHASNYKILGYTAQVSVEELVSLGKKHDLPVVVDLGSGVLLNLERFGLAHEPTVQETIAAGADAVCFSGDKLLGGMQAGIIVGKKRILEKMENHPLMRALRLDKCSIAVLSATFREYLDMDRAAEKIPVLRMLARSQEELYDQAEKIREELKDFKGEIRVEECRSQVGGGSLPGEEIPGFALVIRPETMSCRELSGKLRKAEIPVIGYVKNEGFHLDMRTILPEEAKGLCRELKSVLLEE